jgi:hypothetical protein
VSPGSYNGGEARVCVIGANRVEEISLQKEMEEVLSAQGKKNEDGFFILKLNSWCFVSVGGAASSGV